MAGNIPTRWNISGRLYDAYATEHVISSDIHWHSHFLLNLVTEGSGVQVINGVRHPFRAGSIIVLSPLDFHRNIIENGENVCIYATKFSDKLFYDALYNVCTLEYFPIVTELCTTDFNNAKVLFDMLLDECRTPEKKGGNIFACNLIQQLVILALRNLHTERNTTECDEKIRCALLFMQYNFRRALKVDEVARHVNYSPNYFSSSFKKSLGLEFRKYLQNLRLDFAMNLVRFSALSVTEVCFESGFSTLPHFSSAFKRKFGYPPEHFRSTGSERSKLEQP